MAKPTAEDVSIVIHQFINGAAKDDIARLVELIGKEHPTLQQRLAGMFFKCIQMWADRAQKCWFDGRSERTCRISAKIDAYMAENDPMGKHWDYVPLV